MQLKGGLLEPSSAKVNSYPKRFKSLLLCDWWYILSWHAVYVHHWSNLIQSIQLSHKIQTVISHLISQCLVNGLKWLLLLVCFGALLRIRTACTQNGAEALSIWQCNSNVWVNSTDVDLQIMCVLVITITWILMDYIAATSFFIFRGSSRLFFLLYCMCDLVFVWPFLSPFLSDGGGCNDDGDYYGSYILLMQQI